jgi:hypothetical protein
MQIAKKRNKRSNYFVVLLFIQIFLVLWRDLVVHEARERINSVSLMLVGSQANVKIKVAWNHSEKQKGALALHAL